MKALPRAIVALSSLVLLGGGVLLALPAQTPRPACTIAGRVVNSATALPGVSVTATRQGQVVAATSTDMNGAYRLRIPEGEFVVSAELAAFARFEKALTVSTDSCEVPLDVQLVLVRVTALLPVGVEGRVSGASHGSDDVGVVVDDDCNASPVGELPEQLNLDGSGRTAIALRSHDHAVTAHALIRQPPLGVGCQPARPTISIRRW